MKSPVTPLHFAVFRIALGCYLAIHFAALIPYAEELFGAAGIFADPSLNFTYGLFPNPLHGLISPTAMLVGATALSLLLAADVGRRTCSLLLWFAWACLFNRNNLIANPGLPYVGLLLLLSAVTPGRGSRVQVAPVAYWGAWLLLAAGYTFSGLIKLGSPSWIDGTALLRVAENPLARAGWLRDTFVSLPLPVLKVMTWGSLALEIAALPCLFHRRTRAANWCLLVGMHLGIVLLLDFADLTAGMLLVHLFTFDPRWLRDRGQSNVKDRRDKKDAPGGSGGPPETVLSAARREGTSSPRYSSCRFQATQSS